SRSRRARRLFRQPRHRLAPVKLAHDVGERDLARGKHDQQMVEHVGSFGRQPRAVALDRLDDRLDRLFAELRGAGLGPAGQKPRGPRAVGIRAPARLDGARQPFERVHVSLMGMPARAMCSLAAAIVKVPKWKIEAASTAEAWPSLTPSTR